MRFMGGLRKQMPVTWITAWVGTLALIGTPFFAGFYSKDSIIAAVKHSEIAGSGFAYPALLFGVFITALYSFRMYFMVFHGKERMDEHTREHLHETPKVVTIPLILLAIPSVVIGAIFVDQMAFGGFFGDAIYVSSAHQIPEEVAHHFHSWWGLIVHSLSDLPVYFAGAGVLVAWYFTLKNPQLAEGIKQRFIVVYRILENKYGFDRFNEVFFAGGSRVLGRLFWNVGDVTLIDGVLVNGSARAVGWFSSVIRHVQTGYLYHYAFAMILGLMGFLLWIVYF
jgi:NADH-quinone oxidoreductase subunit L